MWAEEATTHLQHSFNANIWEILFFIPYNEGYICLNRNITTILVGLLDVSFAAGITTYTALLVQLIPYFIIILSSQSFWGSNIQRLLLSTTLIVIPVGTGETWLNTTCSHYHFGILTFIILLDLHENISGKKLIGHTIIICIGALSSPITCFMFPSFMLAKYLYKRKVSNSLLIPYSICCLMQFIISFINIKEKKGLGATRFEGFNFLDFPSILINNVAIKGTTGEIGLNFSITIVNTLSKVLALDHHYIYWISFFVIISGTGVIIKNKRVFNKRITLMIFSFVSVYLLTFFSVSSNLTLLDRNAFVPAVILITLLFFILKNLKSIQKILLASLYFVIAFYEFYKIDDIYYSDNWPSWSNEITKWRVDRMYKPRVWPRNNKCWSFLSENDWRVTIPPETE